LKSCLKENLMPTHVETLEQEVLKLNNADRTRILETLIASLDDAVAMQANWINEALRREAGVEAGEEVMLSADDVLAELRTRYA
jgi:hypothetical protein